MTLRGVLDVVLTDPAMARVVASVGNASLAVTAPPPVQPLVAGALAAARGDDILEKMLRSFHEDCSWHREWTAVLVRLLVEGDDANRAAIEGWVARWLPFATAAVDAVRPVFETDAAGAGGLARGPGRVGTVLRAQSRWKTSVSRTLASSAVLFPGASKKGAISRCHRAFTSVAAMARSAAAKSSA